MGSIDHRNEWASFLYPPTYRSWWRALRSMLLLCFANHMERVFHLHAESKCTIFVGWSWCVGCCTHEWTGKLPILRFTTSVLASTAAGGPFTDEHFSTETGCVQDAGLNVHTYQHTHPSGNTCHCVPTGGGVPKNGTKYTVQTIVSYSRLLSRLPMLNVRRSICSVASVGHVHRQRHGYQLFDGSPFNNTLARAFKNKRHRNTDQLEKRR